MSTATEEPLVTHPTPVPENSCSKSDKMLDQKHAAKDSVSTAFVAPTRSKPGLDDDLDLNKKTLSSRLKTIRTSFSYLYHLSPQQVDDFMASYIIYNLDWADEEEMISELGPNYKERVGQCLKAYYAVLNHLCALGDVEKMYIPPVMNKRAGVIENQLLYEREMMRALDIQPGDKVIDLGCGRGRIAAHVAAITGAHVTGLNIDPTQINEAQLFSQQRGLNDNVFMVRDFNERPFPFPDGSFDVFYEVQALSLCNDLPAIFREMYRLLRPGGRLSVLDWVRLPAFDRNNPEHASLMRRTKPLVGAVGTPSPAEFENAMIDAGFVMKKSAIEGIGGVQWPLIAKTDSYFRALRQLVLFLVKLHCLPAHFKTLINRLCLDGEAFVQMDKLGLITTTYWLIAEKPTAAAAAAA